MIIADIHTHILPWLDDGPSDMKTAMDMLEAAYWNGTRHIVATSHFGGQGYWVAKEAIETGVASLSEELHARGLNIKLYAGHEVMLTPDVTNQLLAGNVNTINNAGFLLLELPFGVHIPNLHEVINDIAEATRLRIILAHPERYDYLAAHPETIAALTDLGVLIQINGDSLSGKNGRTAKHFAIKMLNKKQVHFVASDTHDPVHRPPSLKEAYTYVSQHYSSQTAKNLFYENAIRVINGRAPLINEK
ncbi:MAG: hypothetical protein LBS74_08560 [Oscillospiraceae bacterium]|jgi:protein-tyrosine phosphatase|nr:hypothetical protein [Oscillospiraceae bacterium]